MSRGPLLSVSGSWPSRGAQHKARPQGIRPQNQPEPVRVRRQAISRRRQTELQAPLPRAPRSARSVGVAPSGRRGARRRDPRRLPSSSQSRRVWGSPSLALPTRSRGRGCRRAARSGGGPGGRAQAAAARWQCWRSASGSRASSWASSAARGSGASSAQKRRRCSWLARCSRARRSASEAMLPPPAALALVTRALRPVSRDPQAVQTPAGRARGAPP